MNTGTFLKASFVTGFVISMIAVLIKIMHYAGADTWLWAGLLIWAFFIVLAIVEVSRSQRIPGHEKVMWIIGFICAGFITGIIYLAIGRKRVMFAA